MDFRQLEWPLDALPLEIWRRLCDQLDCVTSLGNGYPMLADKLGIYSPREIELFSVRCGTNSIIPSSPTYMLLVDFAQRRGTIQQVQIALEQMRHVAAEIIPQNLGTVYRSVVSYSQRQAPRPMPAYPNEIGYQNTEPPICNCPHCTGNNVGYNQQPVRPMYPEESFQSPRAPPSRHYQGPPVYPTQPRRINEPPPPPYREVTTSTTRSGQYSDNDRVHLPEQTDQPGRQPSRQQVRSELGDNDYTRVCEHCRRQADPEETVVMTVSGEKTPRCECAFENLALTSVYRQRPIGKTNSDISSHTTDRSTLSSSFEIDPGYSTHRSPGQRSGRNQPDNDRRSWPTSSPNDGDHKFRNCSSDSQLSLHHDSRTPKQGISNQTELPITETMYSRISGSNESDANHQFNNNLDIDEMENELDENDNLVPNIPLSNSMNETRSRQTSQGNTQSSANCRVNGISGTLNQVRVFVTYAWNAETDSQTFLEEVVECCQQLKNAGAKVKIDMDEQSYSALRLNKLDWIDQNMQQATYILVCITPTYLNDVTEQTEREESPRIGQLNARYVFDKLRLEYYQNNSVNHRVIPVMFPNYRTLEQHVPAFMRTTLVHTYPNNDNSIVNTVFGRGRYRPT